MMEERRKKGEEGFPLRPPPNLMPMEPRDGLFMQIDNKRKMKSPHQLEALEMFYDEHKYPSEKMKFEFANDIGLSLKQVSGWFCHRRAKDKKTVKEQCVKYDVSDGGHDDYSTGLVQESCSSTNHQDLRQSGRSEVESKMFHGMNFTKQVSLPEEPCHSLHSRHRSTTDDVTGESSSESQDILLPVIEKHDTWRHIDKDVKYNSTYFKDLNNKKTVLQEEYVSSTDLEQFYINSVKKKLGRFFDENGPRISIDFDPLPPGAFDPSIIDTVNASEAYYVGDHHKANLYNMRKVSRQPMTSVMEIGEDCSSEDLDFISKKHETSQRYTIDNRMALHPSLYDDRRTKVNKRRKLLGNQCPFPNVEENVKQRMMKRDLKILNKHKTSDNSAQIKDVHLYGKKKRVSIPGNGKYQINAYMLENAKNFLLKESRVSINDVEGSSVQRGVVT